jgi:hypothetical protein
MVSPVRIRVPPLKKVLQMEENTKTLDSAAFGSSVAAMRRDTMVTATADYVGRRDRGATLHSSKVRTANRPFALYRTRISLPHSSTSALWGR